MAHVLTRQPSGMALRAAQDALEQLMALPYDAFQRGPPPVPCHTERVAYLNEIKALDAAPPDPQVTCGGQEMGPTVASTKQCQLASMSPIDQRGPWRCSDLCGAIGIALCQCVPVL